MPEDDPGVTVPSEANVGFSADRTSIVVSARGCSSSVTVTESPFRPGASTGVISFWRRCRPSSAFRCDASENSSCSSRGMPYLRARFSAVSPMTHPDRGSRKPSRYMPS